jgi:glycosyltransferase involved in cell wall biosynthesis
VEQYLEECLDSILSQGIDALEVICINDGSMDASLELVQKYAKDDPRFTVVDQINAGQSVARNIGIGLARGEYLYFMDSDDYLVPGALQKLLDTARNYCTDIVYFGAESFFEDKDLKLDHANYVNFYKRQPTFDHSVSGDVLLMDQLENWLFRCSIPLQFIRREFLLDTGLRFKEGIIHEDELISCMLAVKSQRSLVIADDLYMRRVRANSTMTAVYTAGKFIGFFIVATTLMSFAVCDSTLTKTGREAVLFHANKILRDAKNTYRHLPESEKDKIVDMLPVEYQPYFFEMCNSFEGNYNDFIAIKKSMSYRIGLAITWLPRKLMRGVKCVKDHGFGYTVGHVFRKGFLMVAKIFRRRKGGNLKGFSKCVKDHGLGYTLKLGLKKLTRR